MSIKTYYMVSRYVGHYRLFCKRHITINISIKKHYCTKLKEFTNSYHAIKKTVFEKVIQCLVECLFFYPKIF